MINQCCMHFHLSRCFHVCFWSETRRGTVSTMYSSSAASPSASPATVDGVALSQENIVVLNTLHNLQRIMDFQFNMHSTSAKQHSRLMAVHGFYNWNNCDSNHWHTLNKHDQDLTDSTSACFIFLLNKQLSVLQTLRNMAGDMSQLNITKIMRLRGIMFNNL